MDAKVNEILDALREIPDPELGIDIVELGLIYDVAVSGASASVTYSLTQRECPMQRQIHDAIVSRVQRVPGIDEVSVQLTFDPPWTAELMSDDAKVVLGAVPLPRHTFADTSRYSGFRAL
jgi:metal-sulfur cluster biosynthetic enzyme